jgi:uracil phosphoribosyltransferase
MNMTAEPLAAATGKVVEVDHPLVKHKLTLLRRVECDTAQFRSLVEEIANLLTYEATRDLPVEPLEIETPIERMTGSSVSGKKVAVVPILRAGLGMVDGVLRMVPVARIGHIGL